jgi:hypothetical protein
MMSLSQWATDGAEEVDDVRRGLLSAHSALASLHVEQTKILAGLTDTKTTPEDATKQAMLFRPASEKCSGTTRRSHASRSLPCIRRTGSTPTRCR